KRSFLWRLCGGHAHVQLVGARPMHSAEFIDRQSNICPGVFGWRDLYQWEGMRSNSAGATGTRHGSTVLLIFAGSPPPPMSNLSKILWITAMLLICGIGIFAGNGRDFLIGGNRAAVAEARFSVAALEAELRAVYPEFSGAID